jgi:hypothetical protein
MNPSRSFATTAPGIRSGEGILAFSGSTDDARLNTAHPDVRLDSRRPLT